MHTLRSPTIPCAGLLTLVLASGVLLCGCGKRAAEESGPHATLQATPLAIADMDAAARAQVTRALAARDALKQRLGGRLKAALRAEGPGKAISICQEAAPSIAASVGREQGLRIGRTSFKLRNPENDAPTWAAAAIAARSEEPVWYERPGGGLAGLLPIRTGALCMKCHGPVPTLAEPVRTALAAHYPDDRATGFRAGSLRGWFWVDVPAHR